MKKVFIILFFIAFSVHPLPITGSIVKIEYGPIHGDIVYIDIEGSSDADCANNPHGYDYAFDTSTNIGKLMFSSLLAAKHSGTQIKVSGTGTCNLSEGVEDIRWIQVL